MGLSSLATIALFLVAFVWGVEFVLIHNALNRLGPQSFNFIRFLLASLFLWLFVGFRNRKCRWSFELVRHGCALGVLLYLAFAAQTIGMLYTSVSNSGFITGLNVVLVPFLGFILFGERPRILAVAGVLLAAVGLYLLTAAGSVGFNVGDLLTLACAAVLALHIIVTGRIAKRHDALLLTFVQLLTVTVLSLVAAIVLENSQGLVSATVLGNFDVLLAAFVASILGTGLAFLVQTWAQKLMSPTRVALMFTLEPVFAALAANLLLHEQLTAAAGIGALMIVCGIILAECPVKIIEWVGGIIRGNLGV